MKISARNVLPVTVKSVTPGAVNTEIVVGAKTHAIIKASNVKIGID